ncbi:metalloregulator ArsR/SmtB family transcription factor [Mesorhizobium sp. NBSH29]|uniref:ArsR/SmtB family transcription factor n=1 Tax=Mesorhizobium sp. NBSH29 TaxID=2654249 RepID=UPI00189659CE|nr:metalloregulator ArsR/SmtB family transcription factor [Mesorhizobium sp. NBSH29]QPC86440.1 metalloregulator ArsR/SmtB family transcription factor [Mesorhizobium sp. NBSH29]
MVERESQHMDHIFQALSDGTRRRMLRELAQGERSVGELSAPFSMTLAAASKHIRVLEQAGLVRREVRWRTHVCHLEAAPLKQALDELSYYESFWTERLDTLHRLLREEDAQASSRSATDPTSEGGKA